jgi:thymidylate synthase
MNKLDKDYQALLQDILDNGVTKSDRTGTGTLSVFGRQIRHKMSDGFPLLTTKKMAFKSICTELLWFLRGDTSIEYLLKNDCNIWTGDVYKKYEKWWKSYSPGGAPIPLSREMFIDRIKTDDEFAKKWGDLGPIYGKQWRSWTEKSFTDILSRKISYYGNTQAANEMSYEEYQNSKIDQIANLISDLKTNPDSRRLMVNAWNVGELDQMVLPPCHNLFQMYSIEKEEKRHLSIMINIRSNDVPLGLPFNIASYALLLEIIARLTNMISDEIVINIGDAHIYLNQMEGIKEQLTREPFGLPKLVISNQVNFNEGIDEFLNSCLITDFRVEDYISHPSIKLPLSN